MLQNKFTQSLLSDDDYEEDADPRVGLVNLADVMLVFACGLMLALVSYWKLDLPTVTDMNTAAMQEVADSTQAEHIAQKSASSYEELGTAYKDPSTGKVYIMKQSNAKAPHAGSQATSPQAASSQAASPQTGSPHPTPKEQNDLMKE